MSLTADQRTEQNRQNARKSTGPKTAEGKARTRENAIKHGLRADALPIPGEDAEAVAARADAWNEYYKPQSPAAQHLVNECARATLQADRVAKFQTASIVWQQKEAREHWIDQRAKDVKAQAARLLKNPAEARKQLLATAAGCRWLITRWEMLQKSLQGRALWMNREANEAARMLGGLSVSENAWLTRLCAAVVGGTRHENARRRLYDPGMQPASLRFSYTSDRLPGLIQARQCLNEIVAAELASLREREAELRETEELPALAEAAELAYVPRDANLARLHLRYQSEARNAFHRAYKSLLTTLDRDAETCDDDSPNEADVEYSESPELDASPCQVIAFDPRPESSRIESETTPTASAETTHDAKPCVPCADAPGFQNCRSNAALPTSEFGGGRAVPVCLGARIPLLPNQPSSPSFAGGRPMESNL